MAKGSSWRVGVDVGGTFTDLILVDSETGRWSAAKTLTTPKDPAEGVATGLRQLLDAANLDSSALAGIVHGTTLITNAIIERKGAPTALLTTRGFRDAVEIGREGRYDLYDIFLDLPIPLVPRRWRLEVDERLLADGAVLQPIDLGQCNKLVDELIAGGIQSVAICLLHSYRNASHEEALGRLIRERAPELSVSLSSEVSPEIKEYERASTTIANAYTRPLIDRYLNELEATLRSQSFAGELLIMLSSGGLCSVDIARRFPVRLIESGPAAGALVAGALGREAGYPDLLSFDMGGTTAKAALIEGSEPLITPEQEVGRVYRFKRGSGLPVRSATIDMIEIGAGGGSIARIDSLGLLRVGPDSAGADPGPACYGLGGTEPTVTDADLVLGYLDAGFFLGGTMRLDPVAAERAIAEKVAKPLGLSVPEAAWGIHRVVNEEMANAARIHAVERGRDVRKFPLFAFGGAGPSHADRVARILHLDRWIAPLGAGVASAMGFLVAPIAFDFVRSYYNRLDEAQWEGINAAFAAMETEGRELLARAGVAPDQIRIRRLADIRYIGQGHHVTAPVPEGVVGQESLGAIAASFEAEYIRRYERLASGVPIEALSWRVIASGPSSELRLAPGRAANAAIALKGERLAYFPETAGYQPTPVYDRYQLQPGATIEGPAILEERESTVLVGPGARATVDQLLNVVVEFG